MNSDEFNKLYMCTFEPDQRQIALHETLAEYYRLTPDNVSNVEAGKHYRKFYEWAKSSGYTPEEINRAKRELVERTE